MNNLLGTTNSTIKVAADSLFQSLIRCVDLAFLVPSWTNALPFTNVKAKVAILNKLNGNIYGNSLSIRNGSNLAQQEANFINKECHSSLSKIDR
jgi:hypothetical protein